MPMDLAPFIDGRAIHQIYAGETRSCHERNKSRVRGNFAPLNPLRFKATPKNVIPAKAGIHKFLTLLDSHRSLPRTGYGAGVTNWGLLEVALR